MEGLTPILLVLLAVAAIAAFMLNQRVGALKALVEKTEASREEKREEAEVARREARERKEELEKLRQELQDVKSKLKKKSAPDTAKPSGSSRPAQAAAQETPVPSLGVVRISNQELEDQHRKTVEKLELEIVHLRSQITQLTEREAEREKALERAKKSLEQPKAAVAPDAAVKPEEQVHALRVQVEALERASADRERHLKRELDRLQAELRSSERRASSNHQLYQVAKGQMAVIEDRLAALRRKYEGAIAPDQLRKPAPEAKVTQAEVGGEQPASTPENPAPVVDQSTQAAVDVPSAPASDQPANSDETPPPEARSV